MIYYAFSGGSHALSIKLDNVIYSFLPNTNWYNLCEPGDDEFHWTVVPENLETIVISCLSFMFVDDRYPNKGYVYTPVQRKQIDLLINVLKSYEISI